MALSSKQLAASLNLLTLIPSIIKLAQTHGGTNAEKKAAVTDVFGVLVTEAAGAVATNNPAYADLISKTINATVDSLESSGEMPAAPPEMVLPPEPTPALAPVVQTSAPAPDRKPATKKAATKKAAKKGTTKKK